MEFNKKMYASVIVLILLIISILMFISFFIYSGIKGGNLYSYLYKNNYTRWQELTSISKSGPGFLNPFKGFPYIYNDIDVNDEKILRFKMSIRNGLRYNLFFLLAIIINSCILAFFIKMGI